MFISVLRNFCTRWNYQVVSTRFEPSCKKIYSKVGPRYTYMGFNVIDLESFHTLAEMLLGAFQANCCKSKCPEVHGYIGIVWDRVLGVLKEPYSTQITSMAVMPLPPLLVTDRAIDPNCTMQSPLFYFAYCLANARFSRSSGEILAWIVNFRPSKTE